MVPEEHKRPTVTSTVNYRNDIADVPESAQFQFQSADSSDIMISRALRIPGADP